MELDPYIRRGYRPRLGSFSACFKSIFHLHNESVNIWSHILSTVVYLSVLLTIDHSTLCDDVDLSTADNSVITTYIAGSIACLVFSVCCRLQKAIKEARHTHTFTGLLSHLYRTLQAGSDALLKVGLSGHPAECSDVRYHVHLRRSL